jgi:hypothetical protein
MARVSQSQHICFLRWPTQHNKQGKTNLAELRTSNGVSQSIVTPFLSSAIELKGAVLARFHENYNLHLTQGKGTYVARFLCAYEGVNNVDVDTYYHS